MAGCATVTTWTFTGTSPAAAGTALVTSPTTLVDLADFDSFTIDATVTGATGGNLDIVLQRQVAAGVWVEWVRLTTITAGAAVAYQTISPDPAGKNTATAVGVYNDAGTGTMTLASGTSTGGHPGHTIRMVFVAGTSTSAGAAQTVRVTGRQSSST